MIAGRHGGEIDLVIGGDAPRRDGAAALARRLGGSRTERLALCRNTPLGEAHRISARYLLISTSTARRPPWADDPRPLRTRSARCGGGSGTCSRRTRWRSSTTTTCGRCAPPARRGLRPLARCGADEEERRLRRHAAAHQRRRRRLPWTRRSTPALYRLGALRRRAGGCSYDGGRTCEHVPFHLCLRRSGLRLGVAPYLVQGCAMGAAGKCAAVRVRVEGMGAWRGGGEGGR